MGQDADSGLTAAEHARLDAIRGADELADLPAVTGRVSEHDAYVAAKRQHRELAARSASPVSTAGDLPGTRVVVDGTEFWVHGVTHADTPVERDFLRRHVSAFLSDGAAVYVEQGIRPMYFDDVAGVCEMDDYAWATEQCESLDSGTYVDLPEAALDGVVEDVTALAGRFRTAAFSLIDAGGEYYGEDFEATLGDLATAFLTNHADAATGRDFESFQLSRNAARDPSVLDALQSYYQRAFLPQPVEREWLRRHDPELEVVTHARNEHMADWAVYHHETAPAVHLVVGAAHQPGVTYYLQQHRDGARTMEAFELAG